MEKINYDNKIFSSIENTENGEVNEKTVFHYHQNMEMAGNEEIKNMKKFPLSYIMNCKKK
jgi:hypothetical protein